MMTVGWRCPSCGRRIYLFRDHLPRCHRKDHARIRALEAENAALGREVERAVCVLTEKLNAETARAEKAEAELLKDRNEGECYGPFHAGFVCRECADRYRALEAARAEAVARLAESLERWPSVLEDKKKAEAGLAECEREFARQLERLMKAGRWGPGGQFRIKRAAGRDSGGGPEGNDRGGFAIATAAAKSAARHPENEECGT